MIPEQKLSGTVKRLSPHNQERLSGESLLFCLFLIISKCIRILAMKFKVSHKIFEAYPTLIEAVVILRNINNKATSNEILKLLREAEQKQKHEFEGKELAKHPIIAAWREAFMAFGSKPNKYSSSVEALLKRVIKGNKLPDISPLVNLYNYCSIKHILPFGGEDFVGVYGDMGLSYCTGEEEFTPILSKDNEPPDKGEISWGDGKGITCRKWNWRQCDRTKVTPNTREGYFIIDGLPPATRENIQKAGEELISLAKKYLGADGEIYWLDKDHPEVEVNINTKKLSDTQEDNAFKSPSGGSNKIVKPTSSRKNIEKKQLFDEYEDKNSAKYQLRELIWKAVQKAGFGKIISRDDIRIEHPQAENFGDYATNAALLLAGKARKNPNELAKQICDLVDQSALIDQIENVGGFINIKLTREWLLEGLKTIISLQDTYGTIKEKKDFRIIIEFGQPNTHKMPHIGHLFSYILGESIARIVDALGLQLFRANYQGDIGPHVAKCIWAFLKEKPAVPGTSKGKADLLQLMYQHGATAYQDDEKAKKEINEINRKIYTKDTELTKVWQETRSWSVNFYKEFEKRIGVHYDRYYFESEMADKGAKIVKGNIGKVFKKSQGAIIFEGSKFGLHDRVFVTKLGTPTYEAKDMALQEIKYNEWPFDYMIIMTAHEQNEYFNVVFKALEQLNPIFKGRLFHLGFGMINLKGMKMSSRTGNIITGISLVDQAATAIKNILKEKDGFSPDKENEIVEKVGIAATKYSFLKKNPLQNSVFDFNESISFEGDSGPYLQYTYARAKSILREINSPIAYRFSPTTELNDEEVALLRTLYKFPEVVLDAGNNLAPNLICTYLFDLAQKFNLFYKKHKVLKAESNEIKNMRLTLTAATAQVIKNGLRLLGIEVLERM